MALSQIHRSTLKQKNKKHNVLGHRTKGQITAQNKGRVPVKEITKKHKNELSREQRKHKSKQIRAHKREEVLFKKRMIGSARTPPFLITILPLSTTINGQKLIDDISHCGTSLITSESAQGIKHISCSRFKQRFSFIAPPIYDLFAVLDSVKVSTSVIFAWQAGEELDDAANMLLSSISAQGLPTIHHVVCGLENLSTKKRAFSLKSLNREISFRFPGHTKLHSLERQQDVYLLLRQIGAQKQQPIFYRDQRSHLIAEKVIFEGEKSGTLKAYGYIRGQPLSAHNLVHIPGWGEFQISRIESINDPHPLEGTQLSPLQEMPENPKLLEEPDPQFQESLLTVNEVDPMDAEQTWPTEEELKEAEEREFGPKVKTKLVPKGTSNYQAAWILDSDDEDESPQDEEDEGIHDDSLEVPFCENSTESDHEEEDDDEEYEKMTMTEVDDDEYDQNINYDKDIDNYRKMRAAHDDATFPDEIDTPMDRPARIRFQKFRGLQSFRTSFWDPKENLPLDYAKIFQFKNFDHARRRIFKQEKEGAFIGWYVCIHLNGVPSHLYKERMSCGTPIVMFSLLPHEQKMSVLNIAIKSHAMGHIDSIQSKEELIFHVGVRRFSNRPIFSEHSVGSKHKFMRFFHPGSTVVASMFAPITFPPCNVTVFKRRLSGVHDLVATGSVLSMDPNRIVCKRVVLSGHPFKVNKKSAVVRYMFFNREDVSWFKPVELRTKWGRRGHIKEPLGTHGHMKCTFNGQLKSQDTVLMNLYKRVFPKFEDYSNKPYYKTQVPVPPPLFTFQLPSQSDEESSDSDTKTQPIEPKAKIKRVTFKVR